MADTRDPFERVLRNQLDIARYENGLAADTHKRVEALFDEIVALIAKIDPTNARTTTARRAKIEVLSRRMQQLLNISFTPWYTALRIEIARFGAQQAEYARQVLVESVGGSGALRSFGIRLGDRRGLGAMFFRSIVDTNPFEGQVLSEWVDTQKMRTLVDVRRQIQLGMGANESIDEIVRRVRGKSDSRGGFTGAVMAKTQRETEALVRTSVNEIASTAHLETYKRQSDLTDSYTYVATLDSRTTPICRALDLNVYRYDDPEKKLPPQHWNCRSTIVPNVNWKALGITPPEDGWRLTRTGAKQRGKVPESSSYEDWLRGLPRARQDEILGPGRGKLFRQGVTLKQMVGRDNHVLTLDGLRRRANMSSA